MACISGSRGTCCKWEAIQSEVHDMRSHLCFMQILNVYLRKYAILRCFNTTLHFQKIENIVLELLEQ